MHGLELPPDVLGAELAQNNVPLIAGEPAKLCGRLAAVADGMGYHTVHGVCLVDVALCKVVSFSEFIAYRRRTLDFSLCLPGLQYCVCTPCLDMAKRSEQRAKLLLQYRQKKSVSSLNVLLINWRRVLTESVRKVSRIIFSVR